MNAQVSHPTALRNKTCASKGDGLNAEREAIFAEMPTSATIGIRL